MASNTEKSVKTLKEGIKLLDTVESEIAFGGEFNTCKNNFEGAKERLRAYRTQRILGIILLIISLCTAIAPLIVVLYQHGGSIVPTAIFSAAIVLLVAVCAINLFTVSLRRLSKEKYDAYISVERAAQSIRDKVIKANQIYLLHQEKQTADSSDLADYKEYLDAVIQAVEGMWQTSEDREWAYNYEFKMFLCQAARDQKEFEKERKETLKRTKNDHDCTDKND